MSDNETTLAWREVRVAGQDERRARRQDALRRLDKHVAAGHLSYRCLNHDHHVRITCGRHTVDLWPSRGWWHPVGDRGRNRQGGVGGVLNWLGLDRSCEG